MNMDFYFDREQSWFPDEIHCDEDQITVVLQDQIIPVVLFDVQVNEQGQERACHILNEAEEIRIELQPGHTHSLPLPVWLFADDQLVQKTLLEHREAEILIANPTYLYMDQLLEVQDSVSGMRETEADYTYARDRGQICILVLLTLLIMMIVVKRRSLR